ncbi:MAG: DUF1189 family protein [Patescibacteria group bacterium]
MPQKEKLIDIIRASIYAPDFYKALLSKPLSWSIKYFFSFALVLAVIYTAVTGWRAVPAVNSFLNNLAPTILKYYPDKLEVVIKDGEAVSNVPEPYIIKLPKELIDYWGKAEDQASVPESFLVIDTRTRLIDWKEFLDYETVALLSKDAVVFMDKNGGVRIQPLTGVPNTTINKKEIASILNRIEPFIKFAAPILVFVIFLGAYSVLVFNLVYLFIAALLIWLIATKFRGVNIGYKKAYQIGLHAMTSALLLEAFFKIFLGVRVPYVFTIITLIAVWINLEFKQEKLIPIADSKKVGETDISKK